MKYSALIVLLTSVILLLGAWYMPAGVNAVTGGARSVQDLSSITQQLGSHTISLSEIHQARERVAQIQSIEMPKIDRFAVLIETRPMMTATIDPAPEAEPDPVPEPVFFTTDSAVVQRDYSLSMIFVGPEARYVVIDGRFRHEGDRLPDGAEVFAINEQTVELRNRDSIQVLRISR